MTVDSLEAQGVLDSHENPQCRIVTDLLNDPRSRCLYDHPGSGLYVNAPVKASLLINRVPSDAKGRRHPERI